MQEDIHCKIHGVQITLLNQIGDERGSVMHMMRSSSPYFSEIKEVYFSEINPGVIKAWKQHTLMTQNIAVPIGRIRLVLFDNRNNSPSTGTIEELIVGRPDQYYLVHIPPLLWYGFQGISDQPSLVANCTDLIHDPSEVSICDLHEGTIPYNWI